MYNYNARAQLLCAQLLFYSLNISFGDVLVAVVVVVCLSSLLWLLGFRVKTAIFLQFLLSQNE